MITKANKKMIMSDAQLVNGFKKPRFLPKNLGFYPKTSKVQILWFLGLFFEIFTDHI